MELSACMEKIKYKQILLKSFEPFLRKRQAEIFLYRSGVNGNWRFVTSSTGEEKSKFKADQSYLTELSVINFFEANNAPKAIKPILEKNQFAWGYISDKEEILLTGKGEFKSSDILLIKLCALLFESFVENVHLQRELQRASSRMQAVIEETTALHEISRSIESISSLDSLLHHIVLKSMHLMHAESGSLMLYTEQGDELEFKVAIGPKSDNVKPFRIKPGQGISGWVAKYGKPILIKDAYKDERFDPSFDKRSGYRTRSFLCVPLKYKDHILGVITILNRLDHRPFTERDQQMLVTFATQAALAIENTRLLKEALEKERLKADLKVAAKIQSMLIPQKLPHIDQLEVAATYIPCKEMSGDFYDVIPISDGKWVFVMADVSGKSVPGAMLMSNFQATIRTYLQFSSDLIWIMGRINDLLIQQTDSDRYITVFVALYDPQKGSITSVNAGHNPPLLVNSKGRVQKLNKGGIFVGILPWKYQKQHLAFSQDNLLVMYTDGLVEAMDEKEEEFGLERLKKIIVAHRHENIDALKERIIDAVKRHTGGKPLDDDFTLLLVRRK